MKRISTLTLVIVCGFSFIFAQNYNQERTALKNFLVRMYENEPFEGVRIVEDYDNSYLMSVVTLDKKKYTSTSAMNRVAQVKAQSQASRFFNGSKITQDMVIKTTERADGTADTEIIEHINENSVGYVKQLEQLITFSLVNDQQVFIYITSLINKQ